MEVYPAPRPARCASCDGPLPAGARRFCSKTCRWREQKRRYRARRRANESGAERTAGAHRPLSAQDLTRSPVTAPGQGEQSTTGHAHGQDAQAVSQGGGHGGGHGDHPGAATHEGAERSPGSDAAGHGDRGVSPGGGHSDRSESGHGPGGAQSTTDDAGSDLGRASATMSGHGDRAPAHAATTPQSLGGTARSTTGHGSGAGDRPGAVTHEGGARSPVSHASATEDSARSSGAHDDGHRERLGGHGDRAVSHGGGHERSTTEGVRGARERVSAAVSGHTPGGGGQADRTVVAAALNVAGGMAVRARQSVALEVELAVAREASAAATRELSALRAHVTELEEDAGALARIVEVAFASVGWDGYEEPVRALVDRHKDRGRS